MLDLIYFLVCCSYINTYPAIEADSVTFVIQQKIFHGFNNRDDLIKEFSYKNQIGNRIDQMISNNIAVLINDKLYLTRSGKLLKFLFVFLSKLYSLDKGG